MRRGLSRRARTRWLSRISKRTPWLSRTLFHRPHRILWKRETLRDVGGTSVSQVSVRVRCVGRDLGGSISSTRAQRSRRGARPLGVPSKSVSSLAKKKEPLVVRRGALRDATRSGGLQRGRGAPEAALAAPTRQRTLRALPATHKTSRRVSWTTHLSLLSYTQDAPLESVVVVAQRGCASSVQRVV